MILLNTDYAQLELLAKDHLLKLKWHRLVSPDEYKKIFISGLDIIKKNKVKYFLSDIRKQGTVNIDEINWLRDEIFPKALKYGLLKVALVIDEKLYTNIYADNIKKNVVSSSIPIEFFYNEEAAIAWFKQ